MFDNVATLVGDRSRVFEMQRNGRKSATARCAGLVLLGGNSRRMGSCKGLLPFGTEPMAVRVARIVGSVTHPVFVIGAAGQQMPEFPFDVSVVRDRRPGCGPLEGAASGLRAVADYCDIAFVTGCDLPLLAPAFIRRMIDLSEGYDICLPFVEGRPEPLAAVYHVRVLPEMEALLGMNKLRPAFLLERVRTRRVMAKEVLDVDPELASLTNVNDRAEYRAALARAGLPSTDSGASTRDCS